MSLALNNWAQINTVHLVCQLNLMSCKDNLVLQSVDITIGLLLFYLWF